MENGQSSFFRSSRLKLAHDAAQLRYLAEIAPDGERFSSLAALYDRVAERMPNEVDPAPLPSDVRPALQATYNRAIHDCEAGETADAALNPSLRPDDVQDRYHAAAPGIAVVDDLLSPAALRALLRHLLESTIWHDFSHIPGFLAAYLEDGLACPILLQIVDELRAALPDILGPHPLAQAWAFKCLTGSRGIDIHADSGVVSLNFWLTPDHANLEPDAGGLVVHRALPPEGWAIADYDKDGAGIRAFLDGHDAGSLTVAYSQNRAVLFRSDLFHKSGQVRFRSGYPNHRINMTLVFGEQP